MIDTVENMRSLGAGWVDGPHRSDQTRSWSRMLDVWVLSGMVDKGQIVTAAFLVEASGLASALTVLVRIPRGKFVDPSEA